MNRISASILAFGFMATAGTASAQSYNNGYNTYNGTTYNGRNVVVQPAGRYDNSSGNYDYARVIRVNPVYGAGYRNYPASNQRCYTRQDGYVRDDGYSNDRYGDGYYNRDGYYNNRDGYYNNRDGYYSRDNADYNRGGTTAGRTVATVIGGVLGAAVGSQMGDGSGRYIASTIGSMVGGMAGQQVYENSVRQRVPRNATVTVCDPVDANGGGYYGTSGDISAYDVTYEYGGRQYSARTNYRPGDRIRVRVDVRPE